MKRHNRTSTMIHLEHECIIGMYNDYEDTDLVTYTDILGKYVSFILFNKFDIEAPKQRYQWKQAFTPLEDYFDKRKNTELIRFAYCPTCGKEIDWKWLRKKAILNSAC